MKLYGYVIHMRWTGRHKTNDNPDWTDFQVGPEPHWNRKVYKTEAIAKEAAAHIEKAMCGLRDFQTDIIPLFINFPDFNITE